MISNIEAAIEAAIIRKELSNKNLVDFKASKIVGNKFELKNSEGKVLS